MLLVLCLFVGIALTVNSDDQYASRCDILFKNQGTKYVTLGLYWIFDTVTGNYFASPANCQYKSGDRWCFWDDRSYWTDLIN